MEPLSEAYQNFLNTPIFGIPLVFYVSLIFLLLFFILAYQEVAFSYWFFYFILMGVGLSFPLWALVLIIFVSFFFLDKNLRQKVISRPLMNFFIRKKILPTISPTERVALEAGVVWIEKDLFSGKPNFKEILQEGYPQLTAEELAFLNGPVEKLCWMLDDFKIWKTKELPDHVWAFMKKEKFFGMIIPKEYGGLGLSALAHSSVIMKLASRSVPASVTVMVPNSLGPAELLIHYGTEAQRKYFLPRLSRGEEIPCFALTEPKAGSDASSIEANGILFKGEDGQLWIKLNWNKRWITLAAISTLLGLAFRLKDPEKLLGKGEDVGITCALIPSHTPGVELGKRHDPLGVPFYNCPTRGVDVVVPAEEVIIGGLENAGKGWKMLMESLSVGRGISLPAQACGESKVILRVVSTHAFVRKQFGLSLGDFEGVRYPLAMMGGWVYLMEAFRRFTLGAIDQGLKPPLVTAMAKYQATELGRKIVNHGMDIMGGAGISMGPRNLIAHHYLGVPIGITVEGANILTRTLIIFGQGALRAHPYAYQEFLSLEKRDLKMFDRSLWGHFNHILSSACRSFFLGLTRGHFTSTPIRGEVGRFVQKLTWASASFAILTELALFSLGGGLKKKELLSGRFADIFSWMYVGTAVIKRFQAEGEREEDLPLVRFSLNYAFQEIQGAFEGLLNNLRVPGLTWFLRGVWRHFLRLCPFSSGLSDRLINQVAVLVQRDGPQRDRLTEGIFIPSLPSASSFSEDAVESLSPGPLALLEKAFQFLHKTQEGENKIKRALKEGLLPKQKVGKLFDKALQQKIIGPEDYEHLQKGDSLRWEAIQVDEFSQEEYLKL